VTAPAEESAPVSITFVPTEDAAARMARVLMILLGEEAPSVQAEAA